MKLFTPLLFLLFIQPSFSQGITSDTTIKSVLISFKYSVSDFPPEWQTAPISATAEAINTSEIGRSKILMSIAIKKYPLMVLQKNLKAVYFLKDMKFYNVGYGGTNSTNALYLTNDGVASGYTNLYLEQTFHHEFSSILYRNFPKFMDDAAWKSANYNNFDYNDPEAGVGAIRNNESSQDLDTVLCEKGFLTQYSLSGMENDINTFAQNIFSPSENFWRYADRYPRISKKVKLLIAFYNKIDALFTETYFRNFAR